MELKMDGVMVGDWVDVIYEDQVFVGKVHIIRPVAIF